MVALLYLAKNACFQAKENSRHHGKSNFSFIATFTDHSGSENWKWKKTMNFRKCLESQRFGQTCHWLAIRRGVIISFFFSVAFLLYLVFLDLSLISTIRWSSFNDWLLAIDSESTWYYFSVILYRKWALHRLIYDLFFWYHLVTLLILLFPDYREQDTQLESERLPQ